MLIFIWSSQAGIKKVGWASVCDTPLPTHGLTVDKNRTKVYTVEIRLFGVACFSTPRGKGHGQTSALEPLKALLLR